MLLEKPGAHGKLRRWPAWSCSAARQFDKMGRSEVLDTILGSTTYHTSISFDKIGFPTYEYYPSERQLYLDDDAAGRTSWIGDATYGGDGYSNYPYILARAYEDDGAVADEDLGNSMHEGRHHDARGRTTQVDVYPTGNYNWSTQRMDEQVSYNPDSTPSAAWSDMGGAAQSYHYTFDAQNRLSGWSTDAGFSCTFGLDRYGNLQDASGNSSCGMLTGRTYNGNNQVVGYGYSGSGQVTGDGVGTSYTWGPDGELSSYRVTGQPGVGFLCDGLGQRVEKMVNGAVVGIYIRNALGDLVDEIDGAAATDFVYAPADPLGGTPEARIAAVAAGGVSTVDYYHTDALGTTRAVTDASGNNVANCGQNASYPQGSFLEYAPFGAELSCTQSATAFKFTGKYRDAETAVSTTLAPATTNRIWAGF